MTRYVFEIEDCKFHTPSYSVSCRVGLHKVIKRIRASWQQKLPDMGCFREYMEVAYPQTTWVFEEGPTITTAVALFINRVVVIAPISLKCLTQSGGVGVKVP
uniref:Uncharacterized protein n=1 Tax=Lactuca sativa TaxID=4236 RepID=A0A9R1X2I4_LACSA|nr:hypothetical protein LSAT_V11C700361520 [Lactuca sativa]